MQIASLESLEPGFYEMTTAGGNRHYLVAGNCRYSESLRFHVFDPGTFVERSGISSHAAKDIVREFAPASIRRMELVEATDAELTA